jgi:3D (Asp-Asp-Asp) domain-containing protein
MKNLVRGGAALLFLSLFVVFIYAQTAKTGNALEIANDSQAKIENNIVDIAFVDNNLITTDTADDDKKLVKTTASVKTTGAGAGRGAFTATAYCLRGKTAMGHGVRRGIIAADPRVLRLGSRVVINGGGYNGTYLVSDTGSRIKGKKIDIWVSSCSEARRFGRRTVQVFSAQ